MTRCYIAHLDNFIKDDNGTNFAIISGCIALVIPNPPQTCHCERSEDESD
ncbi:hypothetical protein [uncultured Anaerococcus sp.]|nr:hypothetical protein [uncultured Anaerococcus sp.]